MDIAATIKVDENDVFLSFLPLHHTFECTVGFLYPISKGSAIAFCDGIRHIAENIKEFLVETLKENSSKNIDILLEERYSKFRKIGEFTE